MAFLWCVVAVALVAVVFPGPILGRNYSRVVRNGEAVSNIRCGSADGSDRRHQWKAHRVEGNNTGQAIDVVEYLNAEGTLSFTADDTVNTGVYSCVDRDDEQTVFDVYVIMTEGERLKISPSPEISVGLSRTVTITIAFLQFEGTPEHPLAFFVYFMSSGATETLRLGLVSEHRIKNGVATFAFNATGNGNVSVTADFTVGQDGLSVSSNVVQLILETNPEVPTNDKETPALNPQAVAGICVAVILAVIGLCTPYVLVYVSLFVRARRQGQDGDDVVMENALGEVPPQEQEQQQPQQQEESEEESEAETEEEVEEEGEEGVEEEVEVGECRIEHDLPAIPVPVETQSVYELLPNEPRDVRSTSMVDMVSLYSHAEELTGLDGQTSQFAFQPDHLPYSTFGNGSSQSPLLRS